MYRQTYFFMLHFTQIEIQKFRDFLKIQPNAWDNETQLLQKTQKYTWLFRLCPGIQMVAVGNSVAMNSAHKDSDIDLFIVTQTKRMWYVRIFLTFFLWLLWQRKTANKHAGVFCLSFFMTDEQLSLESIAIERDIYLYYRILTLKPIVNNDSTYEKFIDANKSWCNFTEYENILQENKKTIAYSKGNWGTWWTFLDLKDWWYKTIFLPRTLWSYAELWKPFWVIISDTMLKFHDQDKRKSIRDKILS